MSAPSVTIVVINHDYERYVGEAIRSAITQEPGGYRLTDVVVVDDGSTDGSENVYATFPAACVVRQPHLGFPAALTRAVTEASGEWVALCDADDAFEPHKLRTLAPVLTRQEISFIQHAERVVDFRGRLFAEGVHPGGATSTLVMRTAHARDLLPVTNELFFHVLADLGRGAVLNDPLTRYRVHAGSMTDRITPGVFAEYMAHVCDDVAARLDALTSSPPAWVQAAELDRLRSTYRDRAATYRADAIKQIERGVLR